MSSEVPKESIQGQEWLSHPFTVKAHKNWDHELEVARLNLRSACFHSIDPTVRQAHAKVEVLERVVEYMAPCDA